MNWPIYHKNGERIAVAHSLTYSGEWMGDEFVVVTIKSEAPIVFSIGDYLEYRGERYYLNVDPTVQKGARIYSRGDAFVYDNIKFYSVSDELTRCKFLDYVLSDNKMFYTGLPDFSFYAASVSALADRIKANLDRLYTGDKTWTVRVMQGEGFYVSGGGGLTVDDDAIDGVKNKVISVNNSSVWDALCLAEKEFELTFIVRNRVITIGHQGALLSKYFRYGMGNGLVKIEKTTDDTQMVVTRLRVYGNTTNLPIRYYNNLGIRCFIDFGEIGLYVNKIDHGVLTVLFNVPSGVQSKLRFSKSEKKEEDTYVNYPFDCELDGVSVKARLEGNKAVIAIHEADNSIDVINAWKSKFDNGSRRAYVTSNCDKDKWPADWRDVDPLNNHPDNMNCTRLMLPGFPYMSLSEYAKEKNIEWEGSLSDNIYDPYIDSPDADIIGIREATVMFDGSENRDDIYPSVEWSGAGEKNTVITGSTIDDNGVYEEGKAPNNFKITISDIGFDIIKQANGDTPHISMKDGMCGGREFEVVSTKKVSEGYELTLKRTEDSSLNLWFPYKNFQIKENDKFVVLGIDMPDLYVSGASDELLRQAFVWLRENDKVCYKYSLNVDPIFMQRQHDAHVERDEDSLHDTIKAGDVLQFGDDDLDINASITIDKLEIKEGENSLPQYSITIVDKKSASTLQRIQNQVDKLASGSLFNGAAVPEGMEDIIKKIGRRNFLSRTIDDTAEGHITFNKGLSVGNFVKDASGANIDKDGNAEFESIKGRGFLEVPEIRFNRVTLVVGTDIQSPCGGVIQSVEPINAYSGIATLELGSDEMFGSIQEGALCCGYFHDITNNANNANADSDDKRGNITYKGFASVYFHIDEILDEKATKFRYSLRPNTTIHPYASMNFGGRGNTIIENKDLQGFTITTNNYEATYQLVTNWDWDEPQKHIVRVSGKLDGFEALAGVLSWPYSPYFGTIESNLYLRGTINTVSNNQRYIYLTQKYNGIVTFDTYEVVSIKIRDAWFQDRTKEFTINIKKNGSVIKSFNGEAEPTYTISYGDLSKENTEYIVECNDGKYSVSSTFSIRKLIYSYELRVFKASVNPANGIENTLTFNSGEPLMFNDGEPIDVISEGDTIQATRINNNEESSEGTLKYQYDDEPMVEIGNYEDVIVKSGFSNIGFYWFDAEGNEIQHKIVPIINVIDSFTQSVYKRAKDKPQKPSLGSYDEPIPTSEGWSNSAPDGDGYVWMTNRKFYSDGRETQWSDPSKISGDRGWLGCAIRQRSWVVGVEYRNDENAERNDEKYVDVVLVEDENDATGYSAFKCLKTGVYDVMPTASNYDPSIWQKASSIPFLYINTLLAKNAHIKFGSGNQLLLQSENGDVIGGMSGFGTDSNNVRMWIGGAIPGTAPFRVLEDGTIIATKAIIKGDSEVEGIVKALSGKIAGFNIINNDLTNGPEFNNNASVVFRNDLHSTFAGIGGNILPPSLGGIAAVARFENHDDNFQLGAGKNYAMLVSAKGASYNHAIEINGGDISGFAMRNKIVDTTTYLTRNDFNVVCINSNSADVYLPKMELYDDGHVIRFKRLGNNAYVRPQSCKTYLNGSEFASTPIIIFGRNEAMTGEWSMPIGEEGDSIDLVWVRDIRRVISGVAYYGAWIMYKMPRDW